MLVGAIGQVTAEKLVKLIHFRGDYILYANYVIALRLTMFECSCLGLLIPVLYPGFLGNPV